MERFKHLRGIIPLAILIILWGIVTRFNLIPGRFFLPPFTFVLQEFFHMTISGVLLNHLLRSLIRVLVGFLAGSALGIVVGIMMGCSKIMDDMLNLIISFLYPIPAIGWLPLLILWIGIGEALPITIIFICSFFPVAYTTATGIKSVDKKTH